MTNNIQYNSGAIDASNAIGEGFELVKKNYWMYFGISILTMIMVGCIPIVSLFLLGPVMVGVFYTFLREIDGEPVEFGMMFKGFENFVPAMVVGLLQNLPGIIGQILQWTIDIAQLLNIQPGGRGTRTYYQASSQPDALPLAISGFVIVVALVFALGSIIWYISFIFALPLLADYPELGPVEAIKLSAKGAWSNIGGLILFGILKFLVALLGIVALCVGIFFVMPILYAADMIAYRMVYPKLMRRYQHNVPPPPDAYGGSYGQGM